MMPPTGWGRSEPGNGSSDPASLDDDTFTLLWLAAGSLGTLLAIFHRVVGHVWSETTAWLLAHQMLVGGSQDPILRLPGASGAGLDLPRLLVVGVLLGLLLVLVVDHGRRSARGRREG